MLNKNPNADSRSRRKLVREGWDALNAPVDSQRDDEIARMKRTSAMFEDVLVLDPDDIKAKVGLAEAVLRQGDPERALKLYWECLTFERLQHWAYQGLARCYLSQGENARAVEYFERAIRTGALSAKMRVFVADHLIDLQRYTEAIDALETTIQQDPKWAEAHFHKGRALSAIGRPQEALECLSTAHKLGDRSTNILIGLSRTHTELNDLDAALSFALKAFAKAPDDPHVLHALGFCRSARGEHEQACEYYRQILASDSADQDARFNLANEFVWLDQVEDAIREYRTLLELDPDHSEGRFGLGISLNQVGEHEAAIRELKKAKALDPLNPRADLEIVRSLIGLGRIDDASNRYHELPRPHLESKVVAWTHMRIGREFFDAERFEDALAALLVAVDINPDDEESIWWLIACYAEKKKMVRAHEYVERLRALNPDRAEKWAEKLRE